MSDYRYELNKRVEKFQMWVAWRLPDWLMKWAVVRAFAAVTTGENSGKHPDEITYRDVYDAVRGRSQ